METSEKGSVLKRLAILLFVALLSMSMFALVGCDTDDSDSDDKTSSSDRNDVDDEGTGSDDGTGDEEGTGGDEGTGNDEGTDGSDDEVNLYVPGTVSTDIGYESEWLDLRYELTGDYRFMTEEEITAAGQTGASVLGADPDSFDIAAAGVITEMVVVDPTYGVPNLSIFVEALPTGISSASDYISAIKPQLETVGFIPGDEGARMIAGQNYEYLSASITTGGQELLQTYFVRVQGDYAIYFTLTYSADTQLAAEDLVNSFTQF